MNVNNTWPSAPETISLALKQRARRFKTAKWCACAERTSAVTATCWRCFPWHCNDRTDSYVDGRRHSVYRLCNWLGTIGDVWARSAEGKDKIILNKERPTWCHYFLLFLYIMFKMFRMLIHPSSGTCDLFVELFHGLYCSGMQAEALVPAYGYHTTPAKPQRNTNTHRTRSIQPMK